MADKNQSEIVERLDAIESQLTDMSAHLGRLNDGLESLMKSQLMIGSLLEAQQTSEREAITDAVSNEVIAKLGDQMGRDAALLSDRLVGAIGTALGKRDAIELANEASRKKPMDIMWSALSQFQPERDKQLD